MTVIDILIRAGAAAAAALAAYLVADTVVTATTGEHIHNHAFRLWCNLREKISTWLAANQHLGFTRVIGRVVSLVDDAMVTAKANVNLMVQAENTVGERRTITEEMVPADELRAKFPNLQFQTEAPISLEMLN